MRFWHCICKCRTSYVATCDSLGGILAETVAGGAVQAALVILEDA